MKRVCIIGCGSIGSLYAAHLAGVTEVWAFVRRAEHARALNQDGLRVSGTHELHARLRATNEDRKSTRLNSSHGYISYAVFCLKKNIASQSIPLICRTKPSTPFRCKPDVQTRRRGVYPRPSPSGRSDCYPKYSSPRPLLRSYMS